MEKQNKSSTFAEKCRIMKKIYNICLISAVLAFILGTDTFQAQAKQKVKYKLVFHDEFNLPDGSQPDSTIWSRDKRYPGGAYIMWLSDSKDVAFIRNHKLVCRAIKNTNPADTAAMLTIHVWPKWLKEFLLTHPLYKSPVVQVTPTANRTPFNVKPDLRACSPA